MTSSYIHEYGALPGFSAAEVRAWMADNPGKTPWVPTGFVTNPPEKKAAEVSSPLDVDQKAAVIGDPIPIVSARPTIAGQAHGRQAIRWH